MPVLIKIGQPVPNVFSLIETPSFLLMVFRATTHNNHDNRATKQQNLRPPPTFIHAADFRVLHICFPGTKKDAHQERLLLIIKTANFLKSLTEAEAKAGIITHIIGFGDRTIQTKEGKL